MYEVERRGCGLRLHAHCKLENSAGNSGAPAAARVSVFTQALE